MKWYILWKRHCTKAEARTNRNLNSPISIESVIKSLPSRKTPDPDDFNEFFKYLGKKQQQSYININSENKQETVTTLFYGARLTSIPNLDKVLGGKGIANQTLTIRDAITLFKNLLKIYEKYNRTSMSLFQEYQERLTFKTWLMWANTSLTAWSGLPSPDKTGHGPLTRCTGKCTSSLDISPKWKTSV